MKMPNEILPQASTPNETLQPIDDVRQRQGRGNELLPNTRHWLNILGNLSTVTSQPTRAPRTMADSMKIYVNSTATPTVMRLYVYSRECDAWFYVALS